MKYVVILAVIWTVVQGYPGAPLSRPRFGPMGGGGGPGNYPGRNLPKPGAGGRGSGNRKDCMKSCQGPTKCPSRQELRNKTMMERKECFKCVNDSCGGLPALNRRAVDKCVKEQVQKCAACPPMPVENRERVINCTSCLMQCLKPDGKDHRRIGQRGSYGGSNMGRGEGGMEAGGLEGLIGMIGGLAGLMDQGNNAMGGPGRGPGGMMNAMGNPMMGQGGGPRRLMSMMGEMDGSGPGMGGGALGSILSTLSGMDGNDDNMPGDGPNMGGGGPMAGLMSMLANMGEDDDEGDDDEDGDDSNGDGYNMGGNGPMAAGGMANLLSMLSGMGAEGPGMGGGRGMGSDGMNIFAMLNVGGEYGGENGPKRMENKKGKKHPKVCYKTCGMLKYCPSIDDMKSKMENEAKDCKDCVMEECGEQTTNGTVEDASCIAKARQECAECPPLGSDEQMSRKRCMSCLKKCVLKDHNYSDSNDSDDNDDYEQGGSRRWGSGPSPLLSLITTGLGRMAGGLGPMSQGMGPMSGGKGPFSGGRGPMSGGFGPMSGGMGPFSGGIGPMSGGIGPFSGGRGPMSGGMGPFSGGFGPMSGGLGPFSGGFGPMSGGKGPFSGGMGPFSGGFGPMSGGMGPFSGGKGPFSGGMGPFSGGFGPMSGGMGPFSGKRGGKRGGGPAKMVGALLEVVTCARDEENCGSCPTPKEAMKRFMNATVGCMKCVKNKCEDTMKNETGECVRQARIDCTQCPPLTEKGQMEEKKCLKCLMGCAPKGGKGKRRGPRRGMFGGDEDEEADGMSEEEDFNDELSDLFDDDE